MKTNKILCSIIAGSIAMQTCASFEMPNCLKLSTIKDKINSMYDKNPRQTVALGVTGALAGIATTAAVISKLATKRAPKTSKLTQLGRLIFSKTSLYSTIGLGAIAGLTGLFFWILNKNKKTECLNSSDGKDFLETRKAAKPKQKRKSMSKKPLPSNKEETEVIEKTTTKQPTNNNTQTANTVKTIVTDSNIKIFYKFIKDSVELKMHRDLFNLLLKNNALTDIMLNNSSNHFASAKLQQADPEFINVKLTKDKFFEALEKLKSQQNTSPILAIEYKKEEPKTNEIRTEKENAEKIERETKERNRLESERIERETRKRTERKNADRLELEKREAEKRLQREAIERTKREATEILELKKIEAAAKKEKEAKNANSEI